MPGQGSVQQHVTVLYLWHSNVFLCTCMFWYCQCVFVWARASLGGFYNCMRWCAVVMAYMAAIGQLSAHCFITWAGVKLMIWVVQVYSCSLMNLQYIHYGHGLHLVRCQTVTFLIKPILRTHRWCAPTRVCPETGPEDKTGVWILTGLAGNVTSLKCSNKHTVKIALLSVIL